MFTTGTVKTTYCGNTGNYITHTQGLAYLNQTFPYMHCYILEDYCTEHPKVSSIQMSVIPILSFSVFYPSNLVVRYPQLLHCWAASFRIPVTVTFTVTAPSEVRTRRNGTRWEARSGSADQNRAWHKTTMQQQTMGQPRFQGQEVNTSSLDDIIPGFFLVLFVQSSIYRPNKTFFVTS